MKIGAFAKRYGVSRDTVRFYISNGLLIPDDHGAQYEFSQRECQDMETILRLKKRCFSLKEILEYLSILRISTMVEPESIQDLLELLERKKTELDQRMDTLRDICGEIDGEIASLLSSETPSRKRTGVPLKALSLLVCPYCGKPLELKRATLDSRYIYSGILFCPCGYQVQVENGIVKTGNLYTAPYDKPDLKRGLYRNVSDDFVTYLQRCSDFALRELHRLGGEAKIIMEGHCNGYFFLYNHLQALNPHHTYIIMDKYPEMLEMYKRNIERLDLELDILYIADASNRYPLKPHCVDILMDFMGDNEHSLYFPTFYLADVKPYLAPDAQVIGAVLGYPVGSASLEAIAKKYPEGTGQGYCKDLWDKLYAENGYLRKAALAGTILKSTDQYSFECHKEGETLYMEYFLARPLRTP